MEVDYLYYWIYALLLIIIAILVIFMLLQRKKYVSRLSKDEQMLLEVGDKCSFYIDEYNSLKNKIIKENEKNVKNENKKYSGKTALVGDNLSASYSNTKAILENLGFTVDIAESSNYLVDKIKYGEKYDIIFSNNIYRDGTGPECLEKLKNVKGFSTPVIVHTITKDARNHFVNEIGFDDYIEKPVTKDNLIPILEKIFNK